MRGNHIPSSTNNYPEKPPQTYTPQDTTKKNPKEYEDTIAKEGNRHTFQEQPIQVHNDPKILNIPKYRGATRRRRKVQRKKPQTHGEICAIRNKWRNIKLACDAGKPTEAAENTSRNPSGDIGKSEPSAQDIAPHYKKDGTPTKNTQDITRGWARWVERQPQLPQN